jgi:hypothetical protein
VAAQTFPADTLAALAERDEIVIETAAPKRPGGTRKTIIWLVVEGKDAFVRSVRGEEGRWYRDVLADPNATVHFRGKPKLPPVTVRAVVAADPESVARFNRALEAKYRGVPGLEPMLKPETFPTTVRLDPR